MHLREYLADSWIFHQSGEWVAFPPKSNQHHIELSALSSVLYHVEWGKSEKCAKELATWRTVTMPNTSKVLSQAYMPSFPAVSLTLLLCLPSSYSLCSSHTDPWPCYEHTSLLLPQGWVCFPSYPHASDVDLCFRVTLLKWIFPQHLL